MTKSYQVFYWIKANRQVTLNHMFIMAKNAKEACKNAKRLYLKRQAEMLLDRLRETRIHINNEAGRKAPQYKIQGVYYEIVSKQTSVSG